MFLAIYSYSHNDFLLSLHMQFSHAVLNRFCGTSKIKHHIHVGITLAIYLSWCVFAATTNIPGNLILFKNKKITNLIPLFPWKINHET